MWVPRIQFSGSSSSRSIKRLVAVLSSGAPSLRVKFLATAWGLWALFTVAYDRDPAGSTSCLDHQGDSLPALYLPCDSSTPITANRSIAHNLQGDEPRSEMTLSRSVVAESARPDLSSAVVRAWIACRCPG